MPVRLCLVQDEQGQRQYTGDTPDNASLFAQLLDTDGIGYDTVIPGDDGLIHTHHTPAQQGTSPTNSETEIEQDTVDTNGKNSKTAPKQPATKTAPPIGAVFRPDGSVDFTNSSADSSETTGDSEDDSEEKDEPSTSADSSQRSNETADGTKAAGGSGFQARHAFARVAALLGKAWNTVRSAVSTAWAAVVSFFAPVFGAIAHGWRTFASTIVRGWHAFTSLKAVQVVFSACKFFKTRIWDKRMRFSFAFYTIVFIVVTAASVIGLQWSVYTEPTYAKGQVVDDQTKALNSVAGQLTSFVSQIWLHQSYQAWLNFIVLSVLYLTIILVINRFWVATAVFGTLMTVFAIADKIKVELRNEPIIPADLQFITGGNGDSIMSFTTKKDMILINSAVTGVIWLIVVCVVLQFLDRRRGLIPYTWKRSAFVSAKNITAMVCRWVAAVLSVVLCVSFTWGLPVEGS